MKSKEVLTIILIIVAGIYFGINKKSKKVPNQVTITGKITNPIGEDVRFNTQAASFLEDTTYSTTIDKNGAFSISFDLDSSTYLNFQHGVEVTLMYVKPGNKIHLTIDTEFFDETIKYQGSPHSSYLAKRYLIDEGQDFYGKVYYNSNHEEYKETLDNYRKKMLNLVSNINDSAFVNSQILNIEEGINSAIERQKKLTKENSTEVRNYMWESREINQAFNFYSALDSLNSEDFKTMGEQYTLALQTVLKKVNDEKFLETTKDRIYKTVNSWNERKIAVDKMPKKGNSAIDFTYPDKKGNEISLSSFKGNLVYVDVWATWCGPCIAEIPYLQKLEVDYHGKNIIFMSVSVDTDKEVWKKMIKEKELGGVQLWADGWSKITKDYAIFGIPRFMLFDTSGNVISTNAPRPSSDNIRELLDANL